MQSNFCASSKFGLAQNILGPVKGQGIREMIESGPLCITDCPKQPRTSFPFYKFFYPIISAKVSAHPLKITLIVAVAKHSNSTFLF